MDSTETKSTPAASPVVSEAVEAPVIKRLHPQSQSYLGRHLGFTLGDDSLQMAAAWHIGPWIRLIDVTKRYFSAAELASPDRREQVLRQEVRQYVSDYGGRFPTISLTLTGPETALRTVTLPRLNKREFEAALKYEAGRQLPFRSEDCWIDYRITDVIQHGKERQSRAAVLAATRVAVQACLTPFEQLGIDVNRIYHTQDVIGHLLPLLSDYRDDRDYMLVDVHRRRTEISYYRGSKLQFYHVSSLGSTLLTNRTNPRVFEYFAESLATELQNSLDFYGGQFASQAAQEIFIYGDLSYTDELIVLLTERLGFTFRRFPTEKLDLIGRQSSSIENNLAVSLPAVAAAVNRAQIADLLPSPLKARETLRSVNRIGLAGMFVVVTVIALYWLAITARIGTARSQISELQQQIGMFQTSEMFASYSRIKTRIAANQAYLENTREKPSLLALNLKELSHLVPGAARLYSLEFSDAPDRNVMLSGLISTRETPPEVVLAELVENLSASPFYDSVQVDRHVKRLKDNQAELDFSLSMRGLL
jgi:Tfp pilus assembly PilM family ATPase